MTHVILMRMKQELINLTIIRIQKLLLGLNGTEN